MQKCRLLLLQLQWLLLLLLLLQLLLLLVTFAPPTWRWQLGLVVVLRPLAVVALVVAHVRRVERCVGYTLVYVDRPCRRWGGRRFSHNAAASTVHVQRALLVGLLEEALRGLGFVACRKQCRCCHLSQLGTIHIHGVGVVDAVRNTGTLHPSL